MNKIKLCANCGAEKTQVDGIWFCPKCDALTMEVVANYHMPHVIDTSKLFYAKEFTPKEIADMTLSNMVIQGLECCSAYPADCNNCPYKDEVSCLNDQMLKDALYLLRR